MIIKMILTNAFDPDPRVYKEAYTLVTHGHDVEILAWDRKSKYINCPIETMDGIKITRFFSEGDYGSGVKQIFGYFKYIKEVLKYLKVNKLDYIHCHDFDALFLGFLLKIKNRDLKLVYDEHDLFYLYFKHRSGFHNLTLTHLIKKTELFILRYVDYHIVVTPKMREIYQNQKNSIVINNAPLKNSFKHIEKTNRKNTVVGFIGAIRYLNELKILIEVASHFEYITIFIAGKGTKLKEIEEYVIERGYNNVEIFGEFKINQLEDLYTKIDITYLIYPLQDALISLPNKFFESIITETPIIAEKKAEYGQNVKKYGIGWTIDSENLNKSLNNIFNDIKNNPEKINKMKDNMKNIKNQFYWENNIEKLNEIYKCN